MCLAGYLYGRPCCPPHIPKPVYQQPVPIPLTGASGHVKIVDFVAEVTIKQRYENKEKDPIEAVYEFPLESRASVCDFYAEIDDKKIQGKVEEKERAKDIYDDAVAEGHGAYLLEEEKPNKFVCSVGNLPPGKEVLIVVVYIVELEFEEGKLKLKLLNTPYPPNGNTTQFALPSNRDGRYSKEVPHGLVINIDFDMTSNIKSISSPTHPIQFEFGDSPQKANVKLANEGAPLGKDFELLVSLYKPHEPCVRIEESENGKVAMVALYPDLNEESTQIFSEMIFVVDRSGSMAGSRINSVRETLQIFLRSLPEGTLFNIVGFGSRIENLFDRSQEYNEKTLAKAVDHVNHMNANLGGTDILTPLMQIFRSEPKEGIPRQLFILTDGEVNNPQECISAVKKNANTTRVFTFGIGTDASKELVIGMAKAGEGKHELIISNDTMEEKVMRQLDRALKPALTDLSADWGSSANISQTPYHLPPIFGGGRIIIYGFLPDQVDWKEEHTITLHAKTGAGPSTTSVTFNPNKCQTKGIMLYKLASKSMIRDLEDGRSYMHDASGKLVKGNQTKVDEEMIKLSKKSGVISKLTAFVAVEKRDEATEGTMQVRKMEMRDTSLQPQRDQLNFQQQQQQPNYAHLMTRSGSASNSYRGAAPLPTRGGMAGGGGGRGPPPPPLGGAPPPKGGAPRAPGGGPPPPMRAAMPSQVSAKPSSSTTSSSSSSWGTSLKNFFGGSSSAAAAAPEGARRERNVAPVLERNELEKDSKSAAPSRQRRSSFKKEEKQSESLSFDDSDDYGGLPSNDSLNFAPYPSADYGGLPSAPPPPSAADYGAPPPPPPQSIQAPSFASTPASSTYGSMPPPPAPKANNGSSGPTSPPRNADDAAKVREVIKKQKANGSWEVDALSYLLPGTADKVRKEFTSNIPSNDLSESLLITAIICAFFALRYPELKTNWNLVVKKAKGWIKKESEKLNIDANEWDNIATSFLNKNGVK